MLGGDTTTNRKSRSVFWGAPS